MTNTTQQQYEQFIMECDEVAAGSRGFIPSIVKRAEKMGLQIGSLKVPAKMRGLRVVQHGKFGYTVMK